MHPKFARTTLLAVPLLSLAAVLAWAQTGQVSAEDVESAAQSNAAELIADSEIGTDVTQEAAVAESEPKGLDIVMDGSSIEAFNESMALVRETGGEKEYQQLKSAFDYLLLFDMGAKGKPEILASRLNGLTGKQIVKRVSYGRRKTGL